MKRRGEKQFSEGPEPGLGQPGVKRNWPTWQVFTGTQKHEAVSVYGRKTAQRSLDWANSTQGREQRYKRRAEHQALLEGERRSN